MDSKSIQYLPAKEAQKPAEPPKSEEKHWIDD